MKAKGNALFRDGDFRGAADAFRRAIEPVDKVNSGWIQKKRNNSVNVPVYIPVEEYRSHKGAQADIMMCKIVLRCCMHYNQVNDVHLRDQNEAQSR